MIRIDKIWLATEPLDMRAGPDTARARVIQVFGSAKLNGHDPYAYLKDVLTRLPTQKNNAIDELLPHNWAPSVISKA